MPMSQKTKNIRASGYPEITEEMMIAGMEAFGSKFDREPLSVQIARAYHAMSTVDSRLVASFQSIERV